MNCIRGDVDANLRKAGALVAKAAENGAEWVVLPELFNTGYLVECQDHELAEPIPGGKTSDFMTELAKKHNILLFGCFMEKAPVDGVLYNTAAAFLPTGEVKTYRKVHLWGNECLRFRRSPEYAEPCFWNGWRIGMQICYEAGFPEGARIAALRGATALVYCAAFGEKRYYAWDLGTRARALENGCYVVASNRFGIEEETEFAGRSRIVAPDGSIQAESREEDDIVYSEIDTDRVCEQRKTIPYLRDLNTALLKNFWNSYSDNL